VIWFALCDAERLLADGREVGFESFISSSLIRGMFRVLSTKRSFFEQELRTRR